jgi:uncharacterized protein (DUF58 family)
VLALVTVGVATLASAQDISFSAAVDRTVVKVGNPVALTLTLSGDVSGIEIPVFEFPEGFTVASRSQSSSFSIRLGTIDRALTLAYLLLPQQAGTFQLGQFQITHKGQTFSTEPLAVTVFYQPDHPLYELIRDQLKEIRRAL